MERHDIKYIPLATVGVLVGVVDVFLKPPLLKQFDRVIDWGVQKLINQIVDMEAINYCILEASSYPE